ncbi:MULTISPECIES: carbon-nitrogen hydrolase family protein [unclassified Leifsonia]|uniref:carbon-nitrogen hydrolase family protein n=1 Tax=unclassified Leifsonia TaxID=2663824 RepID=UPI0008A7E763|nr:MULTISPECIES: carbon-nitrogen hydrolase family protein [unclassified Leifsonia]SEI02788.1 Predicted amidohydrolase [Leifsonia sp. CL154]SFL71774.1 Predicted amidohydrolase [Leifsonia sp. CL147]
MRITLAQIDSDDDIQRNLGLVRTAAEAAAADRAELVVFPEYTMYEKRAVDASFAAAAQPVDGPFVSALAELAATLRIAIVAGVVEKTDADPRPHNTLIAVDGTGSVIARYRKLHLFDSFGFRESEWIAPGDSLEPVVFEVSGLTFGLMACYDLRFPELARRLADAGAHVVLVCASWVPGPGKVDQWRTLAKARAIENTCFVAATSQASPISIGTSLLADPLGAVLGELGETPATATFEVTTADVDAARERNPALRQRRYNPQGRDGSVLL